MKPKLMPVVWLFKPESSSLSVIINRLTENADKSNAYVKLDFEAISRAYLSITV